MADWSEVKTGDTVRGKDGKLWAVTKRSRAGEVTLERDGREPFKGSPKGSVEIVARAADKAPEIDGVDPHDAAVAVAQVRLGGVVEAEQTGSEPWRIPRKVFQSEADLRSHLYIMHGEYTGDIKSGKSAMAKLREAHDTHHADRDAGVQRPTNAWVDHIHGDGR